MINKTVVIAGAGTMGSSLAQVYALAGWDFFQPWLPEGLWRAVAAWPRNSLPFILVWGAAFNAAVLAAVLAQLGLRRNRAS